MCVDAVSIMHPLSAARSGGGSVDAQVGAVTNVIVTAIVDSVRPGARRYHNLAQRKCHNIPSAEDQLVSHDREVTPSVAPAARPVEVPRAPSPTKGILRELATITAGVL